MSPRPSTYEIDTLNYTLTLEFDQGNTPLNIRTNKGFDVSLFAHLANIEISSPKIHCHTENLTARSMCSKTYFGYLGIFY